MPSDQFSRLVNKKGHSERDRDYVLVHDQDCEVPRASDYTGMSTQFAVHALIVDSFLFSGGMQSTGIFVYIYMTPYWMSQWIMGLFILLSGA